MSKIETWIAHDRMVRLGLLLGGLAMLGQACTAVDEERRGFDPYAALQPPQRQELLAAWDALQAGKLTEAEAAARRTLAAVPGAEALLESTLPLKPSSPAAAMAYIFLASVQRRQGNERAAEQSLGAALRAQLDNPIARYQLGLLYGRTRRHREASVQFKEVLRLAPDHPRARIQLATALVRGRQYQEAEEYLEQLLKRDPASAEAYNLRGTVLLEQGQVADAIVDLRRAVSLKPMRPEYHLNLAQAYDLNERNLEAIQEFKRFLEVAPADDPDRAPVQAALRRLGGS